MSKPSILAKRKKQTYFWEINLDWTDYSEGTEANKKLDSILTEKEDKVGIELYKYFGIRPYEKEECGEVYESLVEIEKKYYKDLNLVAQKTGIARSDIQRLVDAGYNTTEMLEDLLLQTKDPEQIVTIQKALSEAKKINKAENKEAATDLEVYLISLNEQNAELSEARDKYYHSLIRVFLNGTRVLLNKDGGPDFTDEDIKQFNPDLIRNFFSNYIFMEMSRWETFTPPAVEAKGTPEEKKDAKKEPSPNA